MTSPKSVIPGLQSVEQCSTDLVEDGVGNEGLRWDIDIAGEYPEQVLFMVHMDNRNVSYF